MANKIQNQYAPDVVSPPGETLQEILEIRGMSQTELAERSGRPKKTINEIIQGKAAITPDTAIQLERVLGAPASFWNNRERNYREYLARQGENQRLSEHKAWLQKLPVRAMIKQGWISHFKDDVQQMQEMLSFFGVASPQAWESVWCKEQVAFRKCAAFESDSGAVAAWLRIGEIKAQDIRCESYDASVFREVLNHLRKLTLDVDALTSEAVSLCASAGVALVWIPELPRTRVCGAARWLAPNKALIQMSLRYKRDDHLWFSFFHEAGHILLHPKSETFIECPEMEKNKEESEADKFAANILISELQWKSFVTAQNFTRTAVLAFAKKIDLAPGIVVGRMQREKLIPYNQLNDLITRPTALQAVK